MKKNIKIQNPKKNKRRRKYKKKRYMLYYIFFAVLFVIVASILSLTVFFNIEEIEIKGDLIASEEDIIKASGLSIGDNLILTDCKKAEKNVFQNFKDLEEIKITKDFPDTIRFYCKKAKIAFCIKIDNDKYIYISKNDRIIKIAKSPPDDIISLQIQEFDNNMLNNCEEGEFLSWPNNAKKNLDHINDCIEKQNIDNITKITLNNNSCNITFEDRVTLHIQDLSRTDYLLNAAKIILKNYIGRTERGKIIYIQSKGTAHFIPENVTTFQNNNL